MRRKKILILTLPLLLASCQGNGNPSSNPSIPESNSVQDDSSVLPDSTSTEAPVTFTDVRSGLLALSDKNARFLLKVTRSVNGNLDDNINYRYFTPSYFASDDSGYVVVRNGISSFSYNYENEKLSLSEVLCDENGKNYTSLSNVTSLFSDIDFSTLTYNADTPSSVNVSSKRKVAISVIQCLGLSESLYFSLNSFTANLVSGSSNTLEFVLKFSDNKTVITATVASFGKAKLTYIENYLKNPTDPFEPTEDEKRIRVLFNGNNFTQLRDNDNDDIIDQHDYFTKDYYFIDFTEEYCAKDPANTAAYGNRGYLSIKDTVMNYNYGGTVYALYFNGCYMFYLKDGQFTLVTRPDPEDSQSAQSAFTQNYTDITYVMNYPSNLLAVNHFESYEQVEGKNAIRTEDTEIMIDFVNNFNLGDTITSQNLTLDHLDINYDLTEDNSTCKITFDLYFINDAYVEYIFTDFGSTAVKGIEDFIATYDSVQA